MEQITEEDITKEMFDDLQSTLVHARDCYEIWWAFVGERPDRDQFLDTARPYESFFHPISISCFCTFFAKFTSIFDEDSRSVSLKSYCERVSNLPRNPRGRVFGDIEEGIDLLWPDGRKLYRVRNKIIAHRNRENFRRHFLAETGYTPSHIREFLDTSIGLISDLCIHHLDYDGGFDDLSGLCLNNLESLISELQEIKSD